MTLGVALRVEKQRLRIFCAFFVFVSVMLCMFEIFFYSCIIYPYSLVCAFSGFFLLCVKTVIRVLVVQGSFQGPLFSHSLFHIIISYSYRCCLVSSFDIFFFILGRSNASAVL